jgi:hypothetical protein
MGLGFLDKSSRRQGRDFLLLLLLGCLVLSAISIPTVGSAQTYISFGETIQSSITNPGETDTYLFDALAGDKVIVCMATASLTLDPYLRLYDPDSVLPIQEGFRDPGPGSACVAATLSKTGTQRVVAGDYGMGGTETGDYGIYVQRLNNPSVASPLSFGEIISTSLTQVGEVDTFVLDASEGDIVLLRMNTDSVELDPYIALYRPDGSQLYYNYRATGPGGAEITTSPLPETGTYKILALDYGPLVEAGNYTIYAQRLNKPGNVTALGFGETNQASLDNVGEVDTYTFGALVGDKIFLYMATPSILVDPNIQLYDPDGTPIDSAYKNPGPGAASLTVTTAKSGTYTVLALDYGLGGTEMGEYAIYAQRLNNPQTTVTLSFGEMISTSLDQVGNIDTYTFEALSGDVILVRMSTSTFLDPTLFLYAPDGALMSSYAKNPGPGLVEFVTTPLAVSGTYKVLALDYNGALETGNYTLFAQRLNNPGNTAPLRFQESLPASLDGVGELDTYVFDAFAGDRVSVTMSTADIFLDPYLRLYDPSGTFLKQAFRNPGPGSCEIQSDALTSTGRYLVLAGDSGDGIETGFYNLSLNLLAGTQGSLTVSPSEWFNVVGTTGGPFSPSGKTYTVQNIGQSAIDWSLSKTQNWLDLSNTGGTLSPGQSTEVTVSLSTKASTLGEGSYTDTLTFANLSESNRPVLRGASLLVKRLEGLLEVLPAEDFSASGSLGGEFTPGSKTYTLKNVGGSSMAWQATRTAYWLSLSNDHGALDPGNTTAVTATINETAQGLAVGTYRDTITFTNTTTGSGDSIRNLTLSIGVSPSSITCEVSRSELVLGEFLQVSGKITPELTQAGAFVDISFIHSGVSEVHRSVIANSLGQFFYELACGDIKTAGDWTVRASWEGDQGLEGATSADRLIQVAKAESRVTVNAGSQAIKLDETVDISGKFTPQPDCGGDLSGIPLEIHISGPGGRTEVLAATTIDRYGHYVIQDYAGFNALGYWTMQTKFTGNDAYLASASPLIHVKVVETAGYAIIVQGKISGEEGLASHKKTTGFVYNLLITRGFLDDDIKYLTYDASQPGYDGIPSESAVQQAITQWAAEKMNAKPANLYLIMVDHGFDEVFYVYPDVITSAELATWLDALQGALTDQATDQEIIILLGFCRSGSFIDELSGDHRIIIASAAPNESSYKGPLDKDGIREGEYFVSEFFKSVARGKSVKDCFTEAVELTAKFTSAGTGEMNAPFHNDSYQHPLLDDNGDGLGSHDLSDPTGDGLLSGNLYIGVSALTGNDPEDVRVTRVNPAMFLSEAQTVADLWAKVSSSSRMDTIWVEIKAPGTTPINTGGSGQAEMDLPKSVYHTSNTDLERYEWTNQGTFTHPGTYQILYFAKDTITFNVSPLVESKVYKAKAGNAPPGNFSLSSPNNGETVLTTMVLDWQDAIDPEEDRVTYAVLLSKDDPGFTNQIWKAGLIYSTCLIGPADGVEDLSTYYWKVLAIDQYGAIRESDVRALNTNNTNPVAAWIKGNVFNAQTKEAITNAVVSVSGINWNTALGGYYLGEVPPGTHTITANANGFRAQSYSGVVIGDGQVVTKDFALAAARPGDLNGDNAVDMADCILAIRIMSGADSGAGDVMSADVNGDGKIGLQDVLYILQKAANLR